MPIWSFPVTQIIEFGVPYIMNTKNSSSLDLQPDSFVMRIRQPSLGSVAAGDKTNDHLIAFGNACTHMGCLLISKSGTRSKLLSYKSNAKSKKQNIVCGPCPCHGTSFDLAKGGLVILGPASQNLPQLKLKSKDGIVSSDSWRGPEDPCDKTWPARKLGDKQ